MRSRMEGASPGTWHTVSAQCKATVRGYVLHSSGDSAHSVIYVSVIWTCAVNDPRDPMLPDL